MELSIKTVAINNGLHAKEDEKREQECITMNPSFLEQESNRVNHAAQKWIFGGLLLSVALLAFL